VGEWCFMEYVNWRAGRPWSDAAGDLVSPIIAAFTRSFNDNLDDEGRQKLVPYDTLVLGTSTGDADEEKRRWLVADWMLHVHLPTWLDASGMTDQATLVRSLPHIDSGAVWRQVRDQIVPIRDDAWQRRSAAFVPLRERVKEAVRRGLADKPKSAAEAVEVVAAAEAVAAEAVAAEAVAAVAAAEVAAAAVVAAEAAAAEVAAEAVVAVEVEVAAEVVAEAVAAAAGFRPRVWSAVYNATKPIFAKAIKEHPTVGPVVEAMQASGFELLDQLIAIGK